MAEGTTTKDCRNRAYISLMLVRKCPYWPNMGLNMHTREPLVYKVQVFHIRNASGGYGWQIF